MSGSLVTARFHFQRTLPVDLFDQRVKAHTSATIMQFHHLSFILNVHFAIEGYFSSILADDNDFMIFSDESHFELQIILELIYI